MWQWPANKRGVGAHSESFALALAIATNPFFDALRQIVRIWQCHAFTALRQRKERSSLLFRFLWNLPDYLKYIAHLPAELQWQSILIGSYWLKSSRSRRQCLLTARWSWRAIYAWPGRPPERPLIIWYLNNGLPEGSLKIGWELWLLPW